MKNLILFILFLSQVTLSAQSIEPAPADQAVVYFIRPGSYAGLMKFALFDNDKYIGFLKGSRYLRYECDPGEHLFWAKAENVDFLNAELEAGEIYMIDVFPEIGIGSARVELVPVVSLDYRKNRIKKLFAKRDAEVIDEEQIVKYQQEFKDVIERSLKKAKKNKEKISSHSGFSIDPENIDR